MKSSNLEAYLTGRQTAASINWLGIVLLVMYLLFYLFPLGNRPLAMPDETRYAEIPREMLTSGDWVTPRLNGLRYFEKPPLGYWVNAISISIWGETRFAVRLSSALAAGLTALLVFLLALKTLNNRRTALLAAFIHLTFLEVYIIGTFNVLDNLLTLFLTAGIIAFYLAVIEQKGKMRWVYWNLAGASLGLAFLTKGFLALAVPVIVLIPWLFWQGYFRSILVRGFYVILIATTVALPWGILIHLQENDFWHYFFWVEHINRFAGENAQHKEPFYYFLVILPLLGFPWISLLFAARKGLNSSANNKGLKRFLWFWLLSPFLFFSICSGKLLTYVLPCFPPLAILTAAGLTRYLQRKNTRLFDFGILFNLLLLIGLLVALVISQLFDLGFSLYQQDETSRITIMLVSIVTGVIAGCLALIKYPPAMRLLFTSILVLPFIIFMQFATPNLLRESKAPGVFLKQVANHINNDTLIVSDAAMLRAVNWFLKRDDVYLISTGEVSYGLSYADAAYRRLQPANEFAKLMSNRQGRSIAVFCRKSCPEAIQSMFPENSQRQSYGKFSMWYIP